MYTLEQKQTARLARHIIVSSPIEQWSYQGFGMLRLYAEQEVCLHIWCPSMKVVGVTDMHTHPWHFDSTVIAGRLINYLYTKAKSGNSQTYDRYKIETGEDAHPLEEPKQVDLYLKKAQNYTPGESYYQIADAIHRTDSVEGTVTMVSRERVHGNVAYSFVEEGKPWVTAAPGPATNEQYIVFRAAAIKQLELVINA